MRAGIYKDIKVQKKCSVENVISRKEYQELLNYAKSSGRKKYYYIMRTLALTGIRVSELQYITVETLETGRVQVYNKGKIRDVYLPDVLIRELKNFAERKKKMMESYFGEEEEIRSTVSLFIK